MVYSNTIFKRAPMKKCLTAFIALLLCISLCIHAVAQEPELVDEQQVDEQQTERKEAPDPGVRVHQECPRNDRRCRVDKNIYELERTVEDVTGKMERGEMFNIPGSKKGEYKPTKTKYGTKALRYPLRLPTYFLRVFTWPIAIVADQMIKHGVVRKVVNVVSNDERTFWVFPRIEMGFGSGFGGGIGIRHYNLFHQNFKLAADYQIHINMNQEAYFEFGNPNLIQVFGKPFAFKFIGDFIHHNEDDYYGVGPNTPKDQVATYGYDEVRTGGWFGYNLFKHLLLNAHAYFIWNDSKPGTKGTSVEQRFPTNQLNSFRDNIYYVDFGLSLINDTRDVLAAPEKGGYRRFTFRRYEGLGGNNYDYNQFEFEVAQFFRIIKPRHVIVLRTEWIYQDRTGDGIPFYRLAKLDVNSPDRGYPWGRFRDRARAVFNIEYRFPVWDYMDGQLFYDTGRVFNDFSDFSFKYFKHSGGIGIRVRTTNYFLFRLQVGFSPEGTRVLFKTSQAF